MSSVSNNVGSSRRHSLACFDRRSIEMQDNQLQERLARLKEDAAVLRRMREMRISLRDARQNCKTTLETGCKGLEEYFRKIPAESLNYHLRERFAHFDRDGNGTLDRDEVRVALAEMGQRPTEEELDEFFANFDVDGNGVIDNEEFANMVRVKLRRIRLSEWKEEEQNRLSAATTSNVQDVTEGLNLEELPEVKIKLPLDELKLRLPEVKTASGKPLSSARRKSETSIKTPRMTPRVSGLALQPPRTTPRGSGVAMVPHAPRATPSAGQTPRTGRIRIGETLRNNHVKAVTKG